MGESDKTIEAALASVGGGADEPELILERYRVVRTLGRGGMGVVYEAKHDVLGSRHAIKVLVSRLRGAGSEIIAERFLREAKLCVSIRHPNLVLVTDCGIDKGHPVIVMDLIEGTELGKYTRGGKGVQPGTVVRIGAQAAAALNALHQRSIVHRDIKPSNLMLEQATGRVVLMDLGISRQTGEESDMTMGSIIGTPAYMAPEQARSSSKVGTSADVYSLGAAFAALLAARPPVDSGTAHEMIERTRERVYTSGTVLGLYPELEKSAPPELVGLIADMTRFNAGERITCAQVRERLVAMDRAAGSHAGPTLDATLPIVVAPASDFLTPSSATPTPSVPTPSAFKARQPTEATRPRTGTFMPPAIDLDATRRMPDQAPSVAPAPSTAPRPRARPWLLPLALAPVAALVGWFAIGHRAPLPPEPQSVAQPAPVVQPPVQPAHPLPVPVPDPSPARTPVTPIVVTPGTEAPAKSPSPVAYAARQVIALPGGGSMELLLVAPGSFRIGSDESSRPMERPRQQVTFTTPRWLGRYEVTCAQFAPFLVAHGPAADPGFDQFEETATGFRPRAGLEQLPVRGVHLADARAYAAWLSAASGVALRLPGEVEWEYAARGPTNRAWPWGDTWRPDRCRADGHDMPSAVGSFPSGASWCGVEDLAGNLFEWTDDWWDEQRYATLTQRDPRPDPTVQKDGQTVVRGGCFANPRQMCRAAFRIGSRADKRDAAIGFRLITESSPATPALAPETKP